MITGQNLVGGEWQSNNSSKYFKTSNPKTGKNLSISFEQASEDQTNLAVDSATSVFELYSNTTLKERAQFLGIIQDELKILKPQILYCYQAESSFPEGRAFGEFDRTIDQIDRFIDLLNEGSFLQATIQTQSPDLRKTLVSIGPIVVFGASNFPLAFSTAGGDTISALAAGCPVILKAHPYHAGTSEWVARAINNALIKCDLPLEIFSHLGGQSFTVGSQLVMHPNIKGVGFTGSFKGGKALYDMSQKRIEPIPVFAEMGSINPVFILENKLKSDINLAEILGQSIGLGIGQFCTNPGLIVIHDPREETDFINSLQMKIKELSLGPMVHSQIESNYNQKLIQLKNKKELLQVTASENSCAALGVTSASIFLEHLDLAEEVFGPFSLVVQCKESSELLALASKLPGQLTATILGDINDRNILQKLLPILKEKAGRLLFEGVPTGVAVTQAMHHGGPYPATTDCRFTSVGSDSIYRWLRPLSFQDCPNELLPAALQNENPLQLSRKVDGVFTNSAV